MKDLLEILVNVLIVIYLGVPVLLFILFALLVILT